MTSNHSHCISLSMPTSPLKHTGQPKLAYMQASSLSEKSISRKPQKRAKIILNFCNYQAYSRHMLYGIWQACLHIFSFPARVIHLLQSGVIPLLCSPIEYSKVPLRSQKSNSFIYCYIRLLYHMSHHLGSFLASFWNQTNRPRPIFMSHTLQNCNLYQSQLLIAQPTAPFQ